MKTISQNQLVELLKGIHGATFVGFQATTAVKLLKKSKDTKLPCPFTNIVKRIKASCILGKNYKNAVNRQTLMDNGIDSSGSEKQIQQKLEAAGLTVFEAKPRKWGERIKGTPLIEHNGKYYAECIFREQDNHRVHVLGYYDARGNEISKEDLQEYMPTRTPSKTQSHNANEELVRDYKIESWDTLNLNGEQLVIA